MSLHIKIKKGLDIKLVGEAEKRYSTLPLAESFAIKPPNFTGLTPKLVVKEGEEVQAGTPLFLDKSNEEIRFCSPVSGEVVAVERGDKRKLLEIRILADKEIEYLSFEKANPDHLNREEIISSLLNSGIWPLMRQRPFGIIANPHDKPKSIFISAFDSHPLAPDNEFVLKDEMDNFQTGLNALKKLTEGKLHLNLNGRSVSPSVFSKSRGVEINSFSGPHPSGNVGVQIHHIDPISKGELVWFLYPQDVLIIGRLFNDGKYDASRSVALTGSQVKKPQYYRTVIGSSVKHFLEDAGLLEGPNRVISGNVLTGKQISEDGYLNFYDTQLTVIPEGHEPEFMGWLTPGIDKLSMSRTFFSWLNKSRLHLVNTNMHGEERPFVVTGEYEKVFPMDIYPVHLLKAILIEDIELMESLGIYEVVEEDFGLCEFVCTSKIESQDIISKGIELIRKEFG